jgi:hypothetical protein
MLLRDLELQQRLYGDGNPLTNICKGRRKWDCYTMQYPPIGSTHLPASKKKVSPYKMPSVANNINNTYIGNMEASQYYCIAKWCILY